VIVVRHAEAVERDEWEGDDRLRPLVTRGRAQAEGLIAALEGHEISRIVSSPFLRCMQTVEPLAAALGLTVEPLDELGEERQAGDGAALVRSLAGEPIVACVHGGLTEVVFGDEWSLKKGAALVVAAGPRVLTRLGVSA
jgi:phosphohistidine phosphatase SixA